MDNWKKYMAEKENQLSIEEVDEKVWQNVYKSAIPKKKFYSKGSITALKNWFNVKTSNRRSGNVKWAYAFVLMAVVVASCTFKVKSYAKYGDLVTFALAKKSFGFYKGTLPISVFHAFARISNPTDSSSFLFLKFIQQNSPEGEKIIESLKGSESVSNLEIKPVVFEFKESLLSSLVYKAFNRHLNEAKPEGKQLKNTIKGLLLEKGLDSVNIHVDSKNKDIIFDLTVEEQSPLLPIAKDTLDFTNASIDSLTITSKRNTTAPVKIKNEKDSIKGPNEGLRQSKKFDIDMPKFDPVKYQKDLKLMTLLIKGLHDDGFIDANKPYTVQIKEGELYINNKKQSKEVSDKFRKYFSGNNYGFTND